MSKLARQLGLPSIPPALRPSRVMRAMEFPMRAPSTPKGVAPLPRRRTTGADYDTEWARSKPARMARAAIVDGPMRLAVAGLASPDRQGADRLLELEGPVIFAANHHSHLDTPLLLTSIPEPWRHKIVVGAAADYFFGTRITGAMSALGIGAIPIERAKTGRKSADLAAELIDDGWSLLIYPEGGRSPDGWGQPFRGGAAYLAARASVGRSPPPTTRTRPASPPESSAKSLPSPTRQPPIGTPLAGEPTGPTAHRSPDPRPGSGVVPGRWATAAVGPAAARSAGRRSRPGRVMAP